MTKEHNNLTNAYVMALAHYHEVGRLLSSITSEYSYNELTQGQLQNMLKINNLLATICQKEVLENLKNNKLKLYK